MILSRSSVSVLPAGWMSRWVLFHSPGSLPIV